MGTQALTTVDLFRYIGTLTATKHDFLRRTSSAAAHESSLMQGRRAAVQSVPSVIPFIDYFQLDADFGFDACFVLVMERPDSVGLLDYINQKKHSNLHELVTPQVFARVLHTTIEIHKLGVAHWHRTTDVSHDAPAFWDFVFCVAFAQSLRFTFNFSSTRSLTNSATKFTMVVMFEVHPRALNLIAHDCIQ